MVSLGTFLSQENLLRSVKASRIPEPERVGECPVPASVASGGQFSTVEKVLVQRRAQCFSASTTYILHVKF